MDGQLPEATTMVVENGMVVAVGEDDLMTDSRYADFIKKDVGGKTIMPGFIDPHTHMALTISLENMIDLSGFTHNTNCLLYTSPSPRDATLSRMPSSA